MLGTQMCDNCWEVEHRVRNMPEATLQRILGASERPTSTLDELAREVQALRGQRDALQRERDAALEVARSAMADLGPVREQRDKLRAACLECMEAFDDRYDGAPDSGYQWMGHLMHSLTKALDTLRQAEHDTHEA